MADIKSIKNYLVKLQNIIKKDADIVFFNKRYIKCKKIDDVLVCFLAMLPPQYKEQLLLSGSSRGYSSIICYKQLQIELKGKSKLFSDMYVVQTKQALSYIAGIIASIESDISYFEKNQL